MHPLTLLAHAFTLAVMMQHFGIMIIEMFFWRKPLGLKIFHLTQEQADLSAPLAKNQGIYNGFLAAGFLWGFLQSNPTQAQETHLFFLSCVAVAGIYGSLTAMRSIFWVQALPALIAIALTLASAP